MQRRRSAPHTFEGNIAAEKAKLEARLTDLKPGPQMDALRKKIRQLETASHMKRVAIVARIADPDINGKAISQRVVRHISGFVLAWSYAARPLGPPCSPARSAGGCARRGLRTLSYL